jgi:DNA-binding transcriptional LysR family regulator
MDVLKGMTVFAEVARQQGFAPAARALNLSSSAVSRYVMDLEDWLGVQLLQRTTRKLSLTQEGAEYLDRCRQVITEVDEIKSAGLGTQFEPQGLLKMSAPAFIAKEWIQELLPGYLNTYPNVKVELVVVDRFVDLVEEGFDLAIRAGELEDSTLIARRLMDVGLSLIASPLYLETQGMPEKVDDLKSHNCLIDTVAGYADRWPFTEGKKSRTVEVSGNVRVNSGEIVRSLAVAGHGIALIPRFMVTKELHNGELVALFEDAIQFKAGLFAVYPQRRFISANVRSFLDYLVAHLDQLAIKYGAA